VGVILIVLVGVVLLVAAALALSLSDGAMSDETVDHRDLGLPDRPLTADDIAGLRFRTSARGYRMQDVDTALERISQSMRPTQPPPEQ
jgi:DivIVA domain-containing protein